MLQRFGVRALLLSVLCTATAFAQNANTSLRGTVKDPSGAVVPGATITLDNKAAGQTLTATSNGSGEYQLVQIPPAKYTITVTASGFSSQSKTAELLVNQPATVNFALSVTADNVVVDVSAAEQSLNTTDASLGDAKNNALIQSLPSETRNIPDLLSLQAGVFFLPVTNNNPADQDSRSGAVNGGRSDQGNITLDGIDDNDQVRGLAFFGVLRETADSIEEFRVATGNTNADAGRSSGAQVSLVTKSGTNSFHGAAYEYFRPSNTVSNDYFNKQAQLQSGLANRPPKLIRNIFGGDVGGPIFKDKLFFFANYEGERLAESKVVQRTTPFPLYQSGVLQYVGDPAAGGTANDSITKAQLAQLDAGCQVCNTPAYPNPPGANPNILALFKSEPAANGTALGDGLNTGSYTFSSASPIALNTSIVRLDYIPSPKQRIFARGNLQKDTTSGVEQFPGQPPGYKLVDNSKGMTFGDTWTITSNMVNDIRYGYVRQGYGNTGAGTNQGDFVDVRYIDTPTSEARSTISAIPLNNIVDNFNWTKGKHSLEIGANWRLVHQNRTTNVNSFNSASTNPQWLATTPPPQPDSIGLDPVDSSFTESYKEAYANIVGTVPDVTDVYNYVVTSPTSGTLLADGAPISRHFKANEYEAFVQDQWRALPNLTITYGVRYTLLQTPWETHGQQVTPTIDTHAWFTQREASALQGKVYEPLLSFAPSGPYYHKQGYWPQQKNNFAPRLAVAYAPNSKTSIRAGAGIYYDHYGEGLVNIFDQNGSFGLSSAAQNPAGVQTYEGSPRFTGRHNLPFNNGVAPAVTTFPNTPDTTAQTDFSISWGLDSRLKTPYTEAFDFSIQRQIGRGFTLEAAYVGRLGRHLLQELDLAEPVDFVDPQGAGDYYTAGSQLSKITNLNGDDPTATVQAIPYFEHVFPFMAGTDYPGESATQAIYSDEWAPNQLGLGATTSLADIDFFCYYACPAGYQSKFWQQQFATLYALSTIGMSYYDALQLTLKHPMSHGLQIDVNYTYSKSIDWGSDAERATFVSSGVSGANSQILNTWKPYLNKAPSDFDTRSLLTTDFVYQIPFGKGRAMLSHASWLTDALVGGWQMSGIFRATSGLPFSLYEPGYTTNWTFSSYTVNAGYVPVRKHHDTAGNVLYFDNPQNLYSGIVSGYPVRAPYPGEAGERNNFRGDGYLDLDSGVTKSWKLAELGSLKFAWEVYNVTNTNRYDPFSIGGSFATGNLGTASTLLSQPRRMQFSLRYDF